MRQAGTPRSRNKTLINLRLSATTIINTNNITELRFAFPTFPFLPVVAVELD